MTGVLLSVAGLLVAPLPVVLAGHLISRALGRTGL